MHTYCAPNNIGLPGGVDIAGLSLPLWNHARTPACHIMQNTRGFIRSGTSVIPMCNHVSLMPLGRRDRRVCTDNRNVQVVGLRAGRAVFCFGLPSHIRSQRLNLLQHYCTAAYFILVCMW